MLLFIEKQAVVQVFIQQLVESFFDPKNPKKIQDVSSVTKCYLHVVELQ